MASPKDLAEPHKEIRFTRAGQAQGFFTVGAVSMAFGLLITVTWALDHPSFQWWMPLPLFLLSFLFLRLAIRCTSHAYLICTPMGIEIFPIRKPETNLNLIYWTEIDSFEIDEDQKILKLHRDAEKTSGVVVSLSPILVRQRSLLEKVLAGRL